MKSDHLPDILIQIDHIFFLPDWPDLKLKWPEGPWATHYWTGMLSDLSDQWWREIKEWNCTEMSGVEGRNARRRGRGRWGKHSVFRSRCFKKPLTSDGNQYKQWSRDSKEICTDAERQRQRENIMPKIRKKKKTTNKEMSMIERWTQKQCKQEDNKWTVID